MTERGARLRALYAGADSPRRTLALRLLRQSLPLFIGGLCLWLLARRLDGFDGDALIAAWRRIAPHDWALAALASAASFAAVGRYDRVIHGLLDSGVPRRAASRAGILSIALAQTLGLGVFTGALARWRALPGSSVALCTQISALVAVSFVAGLAVVTALAGLILPAPPGIEPLWTALSVLVLAFAAALAALSLWRPRLRLGPLGTLALPGLPAMGRILGLTLADTAFAALALWLLIPGPVDPFAFYPVFLLALGAAVISGTPGGVGPFEIALFALMPHLPEPALMAGILGFRLIYYALPAALAAALLALPQPPLPPRPHRAPRPGLRDLAHAPRAELGIARQNGARLLQTPESTGLAVETGQTLTLLFDPAAGPISALLPLLAARARTRGRVPVLYKCNARSAVAARRAGFCLWHVADEAVIDPARFTLATPAHRQLRRKLRQAEKAGVATRRAAHLPLADMARIDAEWRTRQRGARGLTMGRFDAAYLSHHQVYLAHVGDQLVGFVTFHASAHEICLDLMRSADDAPPGTMQALIAAAIAQAAACGRRRLSLASVPALLPARATGVEARLRRAVLAASGGPGLTQFKSAFAPRYEPLYLAAPTRAGLILAAADLALAVRAPNPAHDHAEHLGIAPTAPI